MAEKSSKLKKFAGETTQAVGVVGKGLAQGLEERPIPFADISPFVNKYRSLIVAGGMSYVLAGLMALAPTAVDGYISLLDAVGQRIQVAQMQQEITEIAEATGQTPERVIQEITHVSNGMQIAALRPDSIPHYENNQITSDVITEAFNIAQEGAGIQKLDVPPMMIGQAAIEMMRAGHYSTDTDGIRAAINSARLIAIENNVQYRTRAKGQPSQVIIDIPDQAPHVVQNPPQSMPGDGQVVECWGPGGSPKPWESSYASHLNPTRHPDLPPMEIGIGDK